MADLSVSRSSFPMTYHRLSPTVRRLRRIDFQLVIDKVTKKLIGCQGQNLTQPGRNSFTKSVLTSQPVYFLTSIKPTKDLLQDLDKLRKKFLCAGDNELTGGKCKVNWTKSCLPKENSCLGILNLEKFARALCLRWLWQEWSLQKKAWIDSKIPCDEIDHLLFVACTHFIRCTKVPHIHSI